MIHNSLDWSNTRKSLNSKILQLPYNSELRKMLLNIDLMINDLSKAEVEARQKKDSRHVESKLHLVNGGITTLEQWIMMAELLR